MSFKLLFAKEVQKPVKTITQFCREKKLFEAGIKNQERRKEQRQASLHLLPPRNEELAIVHQFFIGSHEQHRALNMESGRKLHLEAWWKNLFFSDVRIFTLIKENGKDPNVIPMSKTRRQTIIFCQPTERNYLGKIFGGFIMRQGFLDDDISDMLQSNSSNCFPFLFNQKPSNWLSVLPTFFKVLHQLL